MLRTQEEEKIGPIGECPRSNQMPYTEIASYVRTYIWVTIYYKDHVTTLASPVQKVFDLMNLIKNNSSQWLMNPITSSDESEPVKSLYSL